MIRHLVLAAVGLASAATAQEAVQWTYFGYLASVKSQDGAAMSIGRLSPFFDPYFERDLGFYVALAYYKLAVILEGIYYRHTQGQTVGAGFAEIGGYVEPLVAGGLRALKEES